MISLVSWLVFGYIVGAIAKVLYASEDVTHINAAVVGIAGSFTGGLIDHFFINQDTNILHSTGVGMSLVGALVFLYGFNTLKKRGIL